jgi:hypothetical protein
MDKGSLSLWSRPRLRGVVLATALWLVVCPGCTCRQTREPPTATVGGFEPIPAELALADMARFDIRTVSLVSDGGNRLVVSYSKLNSVDLSHAGTFWRLSTDGGRTFGPERTYAHALWLIEGGIAGVRTAAGNLLFTGSSDGGATWTEPVQINDEQNSFRHGFGGGVALVQPTHHQVYCLWTDRRQGFLSLFFSASTDGGRTWSPNQAVEYDFRESEQTAPRLVTGDNGRLIAVWIDWRDRQTLADIRSSYSDDGGRHWSKSKRVNDDLAYGWQITPSVVKRGNQVYVAFSDFREPGEEGDNDWNIYFARSDDNGATWSKNIRLNDWQAGSDHEPSLVIDESGTLYCLWRTGRESIFGHAAFSYSTDRGRSWLPSNIIQRRDEPASISESSLVYSAGRLLCRWREIGFGFTRDRLVWLEPTSSAMRADNYGPATIAEPSGPPPASEGTVLFSDGFSDEEASAWEVERGTWMVVDGSYMGVEPSSPAPYASLARFNEPDRYILRGRFKLDPVSHYDADIYFRHEPTSGTYYVIKNRFRLGAWLAVNGSGQVSPGTLDSLPMTERRFPFQNNRWYEFKLVVTPERIDYFVNERLMLSYDGPLKLKPGRFGIGGGGAAPTYFDDIVVAEIR